MKIEAITKENLPLSLNALPVSALMRHTHFGIFAEFLPDKAFRLPRLSRGHSLTERKRTEKSFRPFFFHGPQFRSGQDAAS